MNRQRACTLFLIEMQNALIVVNAYAKRPDGFAQAERLKEEFEKRGVHCDIRRNDFFPAHIDGSGDIALREVGGYSFCVYLDKDKYMSDLLERSGLRLFNSHRAIRLCDDKMTCAAYLSNAGLPMPETYAGLLCYDEGERLKRDVLEYVAEKLGFPMIVKSCYGSLGKGVFKADGMDELVKIAQSLKCSPHLFQKYIAESCGRDMRVIVIGGRCVAAMIRRSAGDFRSDLELGGTGEACAVPQKVEYICKKAAEILGLDYCGVDILFGKDGYLLCEVNSNAFFRGIERVTGVNVAGAYAEHILNVTGL